jgi:hypothetical protein
MSQSQLNQLKKLKKSSGDEQVRYLLDDGSIASMKRSETIDAGQEAMHGENTRRAYIMLHAKAIDDAGNGKLHVLVQAVTGVGPYGHLEDPRTCPVEQFDAEAI